MRCDGGPRPTRQLGRRLLAACGLATALIAGVSGDARSQQDVNQETLSSNAAEPRYVHAEKLPAGAVLNASLKISSGIDPSCLSQVGNHVYYDGDEDGVPEIIIAFAHHDGRGKIIAGAPPEGLAPDYESRYGPADREDIMASLQTLGSLHAKGEFDDAGYQRTQAKILAGLRPESLGVEEGLVLLRDLWDAGLISEIPYGIKRHEMVDAIVAAQQ